MDPKATYFEMWTLFRECDYAEALDRAEALIAWLDRGGFRPAGVPHAHAEANHVADQCARELGRQST